MHTLDQHPRPESPPLSPPPLEDSRLYLRGGMDIDSPPNSPPPLVQAYVPSHGHTRRRSPPPLVPTHAQIHAPVPSHRLLPHIDTTSRVNSPAAEEYDYWSTSSASDYPSSNYPSPTATQSPLHYTHAHPRAFRHASHSPAGVPVARSLTARHSIGSIGSVYGHVPPAIPIHPSQQVQVHQPVPQYVGAPSAPQGQYAYPAERSQTFHARAHQFEQEREQARAREDPQNQPSPSPPPSSHHSPQTPYTPWREQPASIYAPSGHQVHHGYPANYDAAPIQQQHTYDATYPCSPAYDGSSPPSPQQDGTVAYQYHEQQSYAAAYNNNATGSLYAAHAHAQYPVTAMQYQHHETGVQRPYSPLLLAASLRRTSDAVDGDVRPPPSACAADLVGYAAAEAQNDAYEAAVAQAEYADAQRDPHDERVRDSYATTAAYANANAAYDIHHAQPPLLMQIPLLPAGQYMTEYGQWAGRVAEVS
ncbi:hypothetical protein K438DRAFT_1992909 [Mycena galopus ATCC 62051]|nr:hypothetical protein K438DRAFT_1992909 [Mycena galopus ATCC 62051]